MKDFSRFEKLAQQVRLTTLEINYKTRSPHIGSSFSIVEALVALYFQFLNISPDNPLDENRDRFLLSKGHACPSFYATLYKKGFITKEELEGFAMNDGTFEHHPSLDLKHGIEITTGSLGHGLSVGAGMALSGKLDRKNHKIYVILSDGELNEGSTWESIMFSSHHKLHNLVALVDCNKMQALGFTKDIIDLNPIGPKWENFNWHVQDIDGHDFEQIFKALNSLNPEKPNALILNTIKGKGVSFMENNLLWHYRAPNEEEYIQAKKELLK